MDEDSTGLKKGDIMRTLVKAGICGLAAAGFLNSDLASGAPITATGVLITTVTAEPPDPFGKVPVVDGVPGAGVTNFDLPAPVAVLQHGAAYYYGVTTENNTYSGTCKDSFRLTQVQGAKTVVLDSGVIKSSYACTPGTTWFWVKGGKVIPNSPGPATLIGTVAYGTSKVSMSMHMVIQ